MTDLLNLETETRGIVIVQTVSDGDSTHAPSADAVYDYVASAISGIAGTEVVKVTDDKGTASADTMGKLYIEVGASKTDVYYTVRSGTSPNYTYSWHQLETDIFDDVTLPTASSSTPVVDVSGGAVGSSLDYARADHQHPLSSAYATSGHGHSYSDVTGVSTLQVTITYTDTTTETKNLLVYTAPSP